MNGSGRQGERWCQGWLPGFFGLSTWLDSGCHLLRQGAREVSGLCKEDPKFRFGLAELVCLCETCKWGCEWAAGYMGLELRSDIWVRENKFGSCQHLASH